MQKKKPSMWGLWIFFETAHYDLYEFVVAFAHFLLLPYYQVELQYC